MLTECHRHEDGKQEMLERRIRRKLVHMYIADLQWLSGSWRGYRMVLRADGGFLLLTTSLLVAGDVGQLEVCCVGLKW